jgi:hypothetical protein
MEGCPGGPYSGYLNFINSLGDNIQAAVRAFQQANGLKIDGLVGDLTWGALFVSVAGTPQAASSPPSQGELCPHGWLRLSMTLTRE